MELQLENKVIGSAPPKISIITAAMIRQSGKSWWQCRYEGGKILNEWDTLQGVKVFLPLSSSKTSRWEDIPKVGIRGLYLLCPNGQAGALEANGDYNFFQLKTGHWSVGIGTEGGASCDAQIIGKVDNDDGDCTCYAWEYETKQLIKFKDNVTHMAYRAIGPLSLGLHTGIK